MRNSLKMELSHLMWRCSGDRRCGCMDVAHRGDRNFSLWGKDMKIEKLLEES